jgi:hypothetical protein
MSSQESQLLNLRNLPARLHAEEAAWLLGFSPHDISVLIAGGLLKPLGRPPANGVKYFATVVVEEHRGDARWLAQASDYLVRHWRTKNQNKRINKPACESNDANHNNPPLSNRQSEADV